MTEDPHHPSAQKENAASEALTDIDQELSQVALDRALAQLTVKAIVSADVLDHIPVMKMT